MDAKPFVLWGDTALAQVRDRAFAALRAWRGAWGIEDDRLEVECRRADAADETGPEWRGYRIGEATVAWMRLDSATLASLEVAMFASSPRAASLASEIALEAREDLLAALLGALRGRTAVRGALEPGPAPAALFRHGAGALRLRIDAVGAMLDLLLPHPEVAPAERAADAPRAAAAELHSLDAAMGAMPFTLQAQIGAIEIDLAALNRLVEGDVIRFGARVEQPLAIVGPNGTTLFHGHLGVHDGARALDLVH